MKKGFTVTIANVEKVFNDVKKALKANEKEKEAEIRANIEKYGQNL